MSTHAMVFKQNADGTFTGIYVHFDGGRDHPGRLTVRFAC